MMLVGTKLISTLPHLTLRQEEMAGSSGKAWETDWVRRGRVRKRVLQEMLGPANTTRLPLGVHCQMLAWVGEVARLWFIALMSTGATTESTCD